MKRRSFNQSIGAALMMNMVPWQGTQAKGRKLQGYIRTNWSQDPFSYGSYSYVAKGAKRSDIKALDQPVLDRLFFAGEATYPDYNSTVHAAYESGLRAAERILAIKPKSVAVVGAGMSGLAAANSLAENGISATVYEGRDRIGGRIWTDDRLGVPVDLGASWIHGINGNPIYALAQELEQRMIKTDDSYVVSGKDGRKMKDSEVPDWLEAVVSVQHLSGTDPDTINEMAYWLVDDYGGGDVILAKGYGGLLKAADLDLNFRLNTPVKSIEYGASGVTIHTKNESQFFDVVLVTVPLGVLKNQSLGFIPPLPKRKQQAISRLGMGTLDKLYLLYDKPFWDEGATWIGTPENGQPMGHFNQWLNLYKFLDKPIIMAFNGGSPALELASLSDEVMVKRGQQSIELAYTKRN